MEKATILSGKFVERDRGIGYDLRIFSKVDCIVLVSIGLALSFVFNVDNSQGFLFPIAYSAAIAIAASVCIIPLRLIVLPFAVIVLLMPDLTQTAAQVEFAGRLTSASLWQLPVGPLSPAVLVLGCLGIALLRLSLVSTIRPFKTVFFYFFVVSVLVSLVHGYAQESMGRFIADFKIVSFLYVSLLLFDAYLRRYPEETLRITQLFFMFLIGSLLFQSMRALVAPSQAIAVQTYEHGSLDSAKGLVLAITFYSIAKLGKGSRVLVWALVACTTLYLLLSYQTRWLIVTFVLGLLLIYLVYPVKRKLLLAALIVPAVSLGIVGLLAVDSEALRIMLLRFSFLQGVGANTSIVDIDIVRGSSIVNSLNQLWEKNGWLTGLGYGSWYSDNYLPMQNLNATAFDEQSLELGRFYRVHDFLFHFLFKFGIVGLGIYLWLFIKPLWQFWVGKREIMRMAGGAELLIVLFGIAPTVITYMWFTGKGNIFCGFYIALCTSWLFIISRARGNTDDQPDARA